MKDLLLRSYYEGMTIGQAVNFIESSYDKKISTRSINSAKKTLKEQSNIDWK